MNKKSAGIMLYRFSNSQLEVFLAHPGGPFWKKKDLEAWTIPKGEFGDDEEPLSAALREFEEETGKRLSAKKAIELTPVKQKSGKLIFAWAIEGDIDPSAITSNMFDIEWPPKSGKKQSFPEIDRAAWFSVKEAAVKINPAQFTLIEELVRKIKH
jgi:predicted NUDIX family NTP pyrophosphohydrolase